MDATANTAPGGEAAAPRLAARGIVRRFGATTAVAGVDLEVRAGQVHALLGENGAGKSTLVSILSGELRADEGGLELDGAPVQLHSVHDARARGIRVIHQHAGLFPDRRLAENVMAGEEPARAGFVRRAALLRDARTALAQLGLDWDPRDPLPADAASRQLVEIARALSRSAQVLFLDEPSASLSGGEVERLHGVVKRLRDAGVAIVYITHRLDELAQIADHVTVLREGRVALSAPYARTSLEEILGAMVGGSFEAARSASWREGAAANAGAELLVCEGLGGRTFHDLDLQVRAGEVVGLAGLVGSGCDEVVEALGGGAPPQAGRVRMLGVEVRLRSVRAARRAGIALLPGDRARTVVAEASVAANVALGDPRAVGAKGVVRRRGMDALARAWIERLDVRPPRPGAAAGSLSGGNQQKAVVARVLNARPRLLLLSEPTLGVDLAAKAKIHAAVLGHAAEGAGVVVASGDLQELEALCDRVVVLRAGRVHAELSGAEVDADAILHAALAG